MKNLDFYYGNEAEQFSFLRIPKILVTDAGFSGISTEAKFLYALMLDRMSLSMKNGWLDKDGRVYIYFTLEDAMEYLNIAKDKGVKLFQELVLYGLIHKKRQGLGKPAIIYVKNFNSAIAEDEKNEVLTSEKPKSELPENRSLDCGKSDSNNTNINNNNINNTDINNNILSDRQINDEIGERDLCLKKIHRNIEYNILTANYSKAMIDGIVKIMLDSICSKKQILTVGCEKIPQRYVRCRLFELDYSHIEYVIECFKKSTAKIRNIKSYILTALYNAPSTIDCYYENQVKHDMNISRYSA